MIKSRDTLKSIANNCFEQRYSESLNKLGLLLNDEAENGLMYFQITRDQLKELGFDNTHNLEIYLTDELNYNIGVTQNYERIEANSSANFETTYVIRFS